MDYLLITSLILVLALIYTNDKLSENQKELQKIKERIVERDLNR